MASIVIKVKYGETLRRFTSSVNENKLALDIAMLRAKIRTLFAFDSNVEFTMTYVDEDGDSVTLADDDDVRDVVRQSLNPLRITVTLNGSNGNGNGNAGGSSRAAEPVSQALNAGVSEILKSVNEPLRKALESVPVELANKASSSAPALAELVEKMKAVYMSQISASMARPNVNTESSTVKESKAPVNNTEAGSSSLKKKDKHRKGTEGVKFRDVHPPKGVDLNVPYFGYESFQTPFDATKGAGEGSSGTNKNTADGAENKMDEDIKGSLNEPLLRSATPTSGSPLVDHMNQMRQYCQDRMAAQAAQVAQVAAEFKKVATDSGRSPSWSQGMLNSANQCPFSGMPLQTDSDSHGHHRHSRGHHWKRHGLDNNGIGTIFHRGVRCDGCGVHPITGPRYKSKVKDDYDLCSVCFAGMGTASDYVRIDRPMHGFRHHVPPFKGFYDPSLRFPPPTLPHALRAPGSKLPRSKLDSRFIVDVNVLDGTVMAPFTPFTKIWRMRNNGSITWPHGSQLQWIGGDRISNTLSVDVEIPADGLPVDNELDVAVDFTAPELPGRYVSYWRMAAPGGQKFGQRVWVLIQVDAAMTDLGETSFNLNLPPVMTNPEAANQVPSVDHLLSGKNSSGVINWEGTSSDSQPKDHELNFPINDSLIIDNGGVSSPMPALSSPVEPVTPAVSSVFNSTQVENALASLPSGPEVSSRLYPTVGLDTGSVEPINYPTVDYSVMPPPVVSEYVPSVLKAYPSPPVMDSGVSSGVNATPSPSVPVVQTTGPSAQEVRDDQEEALVKDLADMGFKQLDLNKEVLRLNNYDLEKSIDSLCGVSDWDPMLDELQEMGFADDETNRRLLKKNNGSIKRVVMDLINGEKA
ncbi:PB1 domain, Zinc finger, ZZ-type, UBA-like, Next to BRCA1, central domain protein [Artemisia annua]|uniref:PB1 domain, Zinc finger, ZZ-type, UBA-like, Next to BRCA1, central domain protein n=1 Tax=Artemisia annua TaxID=35608 RepID=A0A2U1P8J3_ARTAN|nr:PB1 domain, Zinc finger, ZZ-type, UBA-like, Next to BRCA1, central domain protein [Artemisia annua]